MSLPEPTHPSHRLPCLVATGPALAAAGLPHRVVAPSAPGPHPTVVMLHGQGGDEDVMWVFAPTVPAGWLVVAPRGPVAAPDGGFAWHRRDRDVWPTLAEFDPAASAVARCVEALPSLYGADPSRICLMGFSQGAATSYAVALRRPGLVRAIAGLVGFLPTACDEVVISRPLRGLPIFMAIGQSDGIIPVDRAREAARLLAAAGASVEAREYDVGHKLNPRGMRDLTAWWHARW